MCCQDDKNRLDTEESIHNEVGRRFTMCEENGSRLTEKNSKGIYKKSRVIETVVPWNVLKDSSGTDFKNRIVHS